MPDPLAPAGLAVEVLPVALVAGATGGVGRHLALGLAAAGWAVGVLGRDAAAVDDVVEDVRDAGGRAVGTAADVTDAAAVLRAVAALEDELGPTDLLVNCAGRLEGEEVVPWLADPEEFAAVLRVNVLGQLHLVRAVVPGMVVRGGGRLVDLSSGSAHKDGPTYAAYAASKAALFRLGGAVAAAGAEVGIRVFEMSPGVVRTPMSTAMAQHAERTAWTDPADVVAMVVAIGRGELDAFSGRYLRVGQDTPASLAAAPVRGRARTLDVLPWGPDDPMA
ncbi:SDR family NAD(P)-dependent oxidoreductase [Kineococcus gynurae]|uniref:SDR family NAD(P)-dependent oxidoreductase n=1 Tax=Kineococcus gynurae TaxID=452979 RepID=A0ABV5LXZ8_9ACTN